MIVTADSSPLNTLLAQAGTLNAALLDPGQLARFDAYLALLLRWNARTNLTAIRTADGILRRHFVESILAARALPEGVKTLLDFGSGAGFPGLPIAICRPEIAVTLAESQHKKAAFLREAVRTVGLPVTVHAGRAEELAERFDCVTLRAVDRMEVAIPAAVGLLAEGGWLAVLTTLDLVESVHTAAVRVGEPGAGQDGVQDGEVSGRSATPASSKTIYGIRWSEPVALPAGTAQRLLLGQSMFARYSLSCSCEF